MEDAPCTELLSQTGCVGGDLELVFVFSSGRAERDFLPMIEVCMSQDRNYQLCLLI